MLALKNVVYMLLLKNGERFQEKLQFIIVCCVFVSYCKTVYNCLMFGEIGGST